MAKIKTQFRCSACKEYTSPKLFGKCPQCHEWNTAVEEQEKPEIAPRRGGFAAQGSGGAVYGLKEVLSTEELRVSTGYSEFDRVLGGGIVVGSLVLITGEPGIGKSTILLQTLGNISQHGVALYVSGEESTKQISLRAKRLSIDNDNIKLMGETNVVTIAETIQHIKPGLVIIDSIQTMYDPSLQSAVGGSSQVNSCTEILMKVAKGLNIPMFIVAHMTKEGELAGPRTLEHAVDVVLYFEGDRSEQVRMLRTEKNRFGPTHEVGIFEMQEEGLVEVTNPSRLFLSQDMYLGEGAAVLPTMEGTRPILAEVQALVVPTSYSNPRRNANGIDLNRLIQLSAVLEKKVNMPLSKFDIYVNVIGGLKISERSSDLAVSLAIISSLKNMPLPPKTIVLGEMGLRGEIRNVSRIEQRLKEAAKIGWEGAIIPNVENLQIEGLQLHKVRDIQEAFRVMQGR